MRSCFESLKDISKYNIPADETVYEQEQDTGVGISFNGALLHATRKLRGDRYLAVSYISLTSAQEHLCAA